MRSPKRLPAAHSASVCWGWVSPLSVAKLVMSASPIVRPARDEALALVQRVEVLREDVHDDDVAFFGGRRKCPLARFFNARRNS